MASLEERRGGGNKKDLFHRVREKWGGGGGGGVFEEVPLEKVWWSLVFFFSFGCHLIISNDCVKP